MARNALIHNDKHAARILAAGHETDPRLIPEDDPEFDPVDAEALVRMRTAIDDAFERAWARIRQQSAAEVARDVARSPGLIARTKTQLLARIEALRVQLGGQLQLAHRKLSEMSEEDLLSLVADLEDAARRNVDRP